MTEKRYNHINNGMGWLMFLISAATYLLTLEPTASFWDCGEYIAQSYLMEVGHPPGNPFFAMTARFFANFASTPQQVAVCINAMSALLSAATILLLFWTITHLVRRIVCGVEKPVGSGLHLLLIMGSGVAGALAYAWSDSFWFSAVETEVYGYSSFCTALTFWLVLRWESRLGHPTADRYLVAIAYVVGLSIGVHLLNLLCVPAIALVVYYRKVKVTHWWTTFPVLVLSLAIIVFVLYGIVPGSMRLAGYLELLMVNQLGFTYNTGVILYVVVTACASVWAVYEFYRNNSQLRMKLSFLAVVVFSGVLMISGENLIIPAVLLAVVAIYLFLYCKVVPRRVLGNIVLYITMILVGFSCYAVVLIRAADKPMMNVNIPDNVFSLTGYVERDQYGTSPLFYGPAYTADASVMQRDKDGKPVYKILKHRYAKKVKSSPEEPDAYVETAPQKINVYAPEMYMFLPRIYDPASAKSYSSWVGGIEEKEITAHVQHGDSIVEVKAKMPSYWDNVKYFVIYQSAQMYWRYLMHNYVGRQNDLNGNGEVTRGNWICGVDFIDNLRLGNQSLLPDELGKDNKGRNIYYGMPFLLGLIGLLWQARAGKEGKRQCWVVFMLFFMTGMAIVLYLNQIPGQARERDYSFAGSLYAYAIWIGMGVAGLARLMFKVWRRFSNRYHEKVERIAAYVAVAVGVIVPLQMVSQTWDDHDRSGRYLARDFAYNCLASVDKDAILFNSGDNNSFPVWYIQDTEGYRTDVRTLNTDYLYSDWYIFQANYPYFDSPKIDMIGSTKAYAYRHRSRAYFMNKYEPCSTQEMLHKFYNPGKDGLKIQPISTIAVDADEVMKAENIPSYSKPFIVPEITIDLLKNTFTGNNNSEARASKMVMVDMIAANAANGWKRQIAYMHTMPHSTFSFVSPYMASTGLAMVLTPFRQACYTATGSGYSDKAYDNFMHRYRWGGLDVEKPEDAPYLDEQNRTIVVQMRRAMLDLSLRLLREGDIAVAAATDSSIYPLLPKQLATNDYALDRYNKALDIIRLMDKKLPQFLMPDNYEFRCQTAEILYRIADGTNNPEIRKEADMLISSAIDRFAKHMAYFQTLTFWQPICTADKLLYNQGGYLRLLATYYNANPKAALAKIAEQERSGIDVWEAFLRMLNEATHYKAPNYRGYRLFINTDAVCPMMEAYDAERFKKDMALEAYQNTITAAAEYVDYWKQYDENQLKGNY